MSIEECYQEFGGSYRDVLGRLGKDEKILKYLRLFLSEDGYAELGRTVRERDYRKAFEHAHNLKGAALNLSLDGLFRTASTLCEDLRSGEPKGDVDAMMDEVTLEYEKVRNAVEMLGV